MTTNASVDIGTLIQSKPGVYGGRPCISGTRVPVRSIAIMSEQGMTVEQILDGFPHLDFAGIHAALAYYHANKARIKADIEDTDRFVERLAALYPNGWTKDSPPPPDWVWESVEGFLAPQAAVHCHSEPPRRRIS